MKLMMAKQKSQRSMNNRKSLSTNLDLLESDDELPDSYEDIPFLPAYQDDCRFIPIQFTWLDQQDPVPHPEPKEVSITDQLSTQSSPISEYDTDHTCETPSSQFGISSKPERILISKGVFTKRDIFIIKSVAKYTTDSTLLWFIDFLNNKSMQPKKTGCLAENIFDNHKCDSVESKYNKIPYKFIIEAWS